MYVNILPRIILKSLFVVKKSRASPFKIIYNSSFSHPFLDTEHCGVFRNWSTFKRLITCEFVLLNLFSGFPNIWVSLFCNLPSFGVVGVIFTVSFVVHYIFNSIIRRSHLFQIGLSRSFLFSFPLIFWNIISISGFTVISVL